MTIKVGCGKCQSTFAVRDDFAGKAVKCPKCKSPMQVPAAATQPPAGKSASAGKPAVAKSGAGANAGAGAGRSAGSSPGRKFNPLLDLLDEAGVEAKPRGRACPMCAAEMSPTAVICIQCGFNAATGERLQTAVLVDEDAYSTADMTDAEKILAKAEKEIDEMPVSSFGQDFGEGKESYLIATVALVCLAIFVGLGVSIILFMDTIINYFEISPEAISLGAAIVLGLGCVTYISIVAFMASPGHGIACLATLGIYCIVFGFMQGKSLIIPTIVLVASLMIGAVSLLFLTFGVGQDALESMLRTFPRELFLG
ncbi:MAG: hypothetical protein ACK56J_10575 [Planctomycetota bacterium]|jgi:hypothetical protein|nr:hypothetical protein [Blastopirellula sp.]